MASLQRRLISVPAVVLGLPAAILTAPLWLVTAVVLDTAGRLWRFPTVRLGAFGVVFLAHEWVGLGAAAVLGVRERLLGRRWTRAQRVAPFRRVQAWWVSSLLVWANRLLGVRFAMPDPAGLPAGPFILLSRHASMVDTILPAQLIVEHLDRFVHYVLKQELRWVPNLDVYGHRLGNHFVARTGDGDAEAEAIARFAAGGMADSVIVIFPEGTYATERSRTRVIRSLERQRQTELASFARELDHLLPPKPSGTLALLANRPDADVVVFGHVGLEGVAQLGGLRRRLPLNEPVTIEWWHHERWEIPDGDQERIAWLNERWRTLDAWVASIVASRPPPGDGRSEMTDEIAEGNQ